VGVFFFKYFLLLFLQINIPSLHFITTTPTTPPVRRTRAVILMPMTTTTVIAMRVAMPAASNARR
jgi:hypothetical protein